MPAQFEDIDVLRSNLETILASMASSTLEEEWFAPLQKYLRNVADGVPTKLKDDSFLYDLWEDNPVASVGNGTVNVRPALKDEAFKDWFANQVAVDLPDDPALVEAHLTAFYDELADKLQQLCMRTPHLKMNRVLCALYPKYFTTIADRGALSVLNREFGGVRADHPVHAHLAIRARIDGALGPLGSEDSDEWIRRLCLPWLLYERVASEATVENSIQLGGSELRLVPVPAVLRRKGIGAIGGYFQTLLGWLPPLAEGLGREEFVDLIHQTNPGLAPGSIRTTINVIARELDLCAVKDNVYHLTARGINLLSSQDPNELVDHLLTKILGMDNVIRYLSQAQRTKEDLILFLQGVNPGWTSNFAPSAQLAWLASLGVIAPSTSKKFALTQLGEQWNGLITWEPQSLPAQPRVIEDSLGDLDEVVVLPGWEQLSRQMEALVDKGLFFENQLIKQLHAGLWSHPVRHFAVLTGISGSGKTQLALNYAAALCGNGHANIQVIPVQPGWFDSTPLLGYVNPLRETSYRSAPFLALLLRAAATPTQPFVAILDEMNLSHPEQYMAPILSAMETQGTVELHSVDDAAIEIPKSVRYPANLAIIGTLNMDETTHGLSDKVLDRAFTLEFWNINVKDFPGWGNLGLESEIELQVKVILGALGDLLSPMRLHFGWRTIDDVVRYLKFSLALGVSVSTALDDAVYAKILPKLRGEDSPRFMETLDGVRSLVREHSLLRCHEKIGGMLRDLSETGTARFWR